MRGLRNAWHLGRIVLTLARFRALLPLETLPAGHIMARVLAVLAAVSGRARPIATGPRPGQRLAVALEALGPSFIKLGQLLSTRPDLVGGATAADLGELRDRLPPFAGAAAAVARELGRPLDALFMAFEQTPVAAASIAQVHFAVTSAGDPVAVKVLRPAIERAFRRDLDLFRWLAALLERGLPGLRRLKLVETVRTFAEVVEIEMDLRLEAAAAAELRENFAADPDLHVPRVDWTRTARRVLTLERVSGIPIGARAALSDAGIALPALAARLIRVFLRQAFRDGFFHADLHQGNLFVGPEGAILAVDFGIMGRIDRQTRLFVAELLLAFVDGDYQRVAEVHFAAGYVSPGRSVESFAQACRSIGEPIVGRAASEISMARLLAQLFEITEAFAMETQPQLLLLQKTMVVVEGVARDLDPEVNMWDVAAPEIATWLAELLSPEAQLRETLAAAARAGRRLSTLVARAGQAGGALTADGLRLHLDSARRIAQEQARLRRPLHLLLWAVVLLLAIALLAGA